MFWRNCCKCPIAPEKKSEQQDFALTTTGRKGIVRSQITKDVPFLLNGVVRVQKLSVSIVAISDIALPAQRVESDSYSWLHHEPGHPKAINLEVKPPGARTIRNGMPKRR